MNRITIELPLPRKELTPNRAAQGGYRMALKKMARADGYKCAYAALDRRDAPRWEKAVARVTRYGTTKAHPDDDNLIASLKHYVDGIADCGIVVNDKGIEWARPIVYGVDAANPRVVIELADTSTAHANKEPA